MRRSTLFRIHLVFHIVIALGILTDRIITPALAQSNSSGPISVPATAVIFDPDNVLSASQLASLSTNSGGGTLSASPAVLAIQLSPRPGQILTISATGAMNCCNGTPNSGPDGMSQDANITSLGSISGYSGPDFALVGVFTNGKPSGPAPTNYSGTPAQASFAPSLNQVFFIGDGLTGTGSGSPQSILVPATATELWLGIADTNGAGPGAYGDNTGSFIADVSLNSQNTIPPDMASTLKISDTLSVIDQVFSVVRSNPQNSTLTENQIANQAWSAIVSARNGYFGANNEFSFLQSVDLVTISNADHFAQAYYVSTGNTAANNPLTGLVLGAVLDPAYNFAKAIVQSTGFSLLPAGSGPQAPANLGFWALAGALAPFNGSAPPGNTPTTVAPILNDQDTSVFVTEPVDSVSVSFDPVLAYGFSYEVLGGSNVSGLLIPSSAVPGIASYKLVFGKTVATVPVNTVYTFNPPVTEFTVEGLTPLARPGSVQLRKSLSNRATADVEFKSTLTFTPSGIVAISQTACNQPTGALAATNGCDGTYCGTYDGDIVVSQGQRCTFTSGEIHGNIVNRGGTLSLSATEVFGDVQSIGGVSSVSPSTQIKGRLYVVSSLDTASPIADARQMWIGTLTKALGPPDSNGQYKLIGAADVRISAPIVAGRPTGLQADIDRLRIFPQAELVDAQQKPLCTTGTTVQTADPNFLVLVTLGPGTCNTTLTMSVAWKDIVSVEVVN